MVRGFVSFLVGVSFLVFTACVGGGGGVGVSRTFEMEFTFTPIKGGFQINNLSDFGDMVSLNITATGESGSIEERNVGISEFADSSYNFIGMNDQSHWTFMIVGAYSDGKQQEVGIVFVWKKNEEDHNNGGIQAGVNTDGDERADSVDRDDDNDDVEDGADNCPLVANPQQSNTDGAADGGDACDEDDDNDGVEDSADNCPLVANPQQSNTDGAADGGDACDEDDDNDGVEDGADNCPLVVNPQQKNTDGVADGGDACDEDDDNDGMEDGDEEAGCDKLADCDNDTVLDGSDSCLVGERNWESNPQTDSDGDGCRDAGEDIDDDGDGLIEIATARELDSVRYALRGNGSRLSGNGMLDTTGCGNGADVTSCAGYELIANISLLDYVSTDGGKGWQPLGHDTDSSADDCQGAAFNGTFEGNGFVISNLSIDRSSEDCVGLFGHIAAGATIRNLTLHIETVVGRYRVGGLVGAFGRRNIPRVGMGGNRALIGAGEGAKIISSSVVAGQVSGAENVGGLVGYGLSGEIISSSVAAREVSGSGISVGGLVGWGQLARIVSSSVVVNKVRGGIWVGGLVGQGLSSRIFSSSVVVGEVNGSGDVGGLVGWGQLARIFSSSVVVDKVNGIAEIGGLVGDGGDAWIFSSSVVASRVGENVQIGGLVGLGTSARIFSSSVVVDRLIGTMEFGGLAGRFGSGHVAYSYVVSGKTMAGMLVGDGSRNKKQAYCYWDSNTSDRANGDLGDAKTSHQLRNPLGYTDIYEHWDDHIGVFGDGISDEPLAVWCDGDNSESIEEDERTLDNRIWDFGTNMEYPAIRCTPITPTKWRSWWFLNATNGEPQLNRTRLDQLLHSSN